VQRQSVAQLSSQSLSSAVRRSAQQSLSSQLSSQTLSSAVRRSVIRRSDSSQTLSSAVRRSAQQSDAQLSSQTLSLAVRRSAQQSDASAVRRLAVSHSVAWKPCDLRLIDEYCANACLYSNFLTKQTQSRTGPITWTAPQTEHSPNHIAYRQPRAVCLGPIQAARVRSPKEAPKKKEGRINKFF
jgi:uncharacterized protein (UPF0147 family)